MASCTDIPTLTTTIVDVSTLTSSTLTTLTTTESPTTSTLTTTSCLTSLNSTCLASTVLTTLTTLPGQIDTLTNTVPVTVTTTSTTTSTLFSHSCTDTTTTTTTSSPPTQPPPSQTSDTTDSSTNTSSTITTSSTLPNGSTIFVTSTIIVPSTSSDTTPSPTAQGSDTGGSSSTSTDNHLGPIIGGTVGGVVALAAIVLIIWFVLKRRKRWDDIFDHDEAIGGVGVTGPNTRFSLTADLDNGEPKPYQYGLVGLPGSTPPPMATSQFGSDSTSVYSTDPHFGRSTSFSPLNVPGAVATGLQLHTPTSMSAASRPSSSGSSQPLNQQQQMQQYYQQQQQQQQQQPPSRGPSAHSASPSLNQPPLQPVPGWMMNTGSPPPPIRQSFDEFSPRAGSPVSYQEPRRLTVANHRDSFGGPVVSSPVDEIPRTEALPQRDGKGRIRNTVSGDNVLVHSDGGRLAPEAVGRLAPVAPEAGPARLQTPAPPAYTE